MLIPGEALIRRGGDYLGKYGIYKYVHPFNKNKYFIENVCFVADKQLTTYKQQTKNATKDHKVPQAKIYKTNNHNKFRISQPTKQQGTY